MKRLLLAVIMVAAWSLEGYAQIPSAAGWHELSGTDLRSVCPPDNFGGETYQFSFYCQGVIRAWGSAVMDTTRNRLVVWGGGHNDYAGNELYSINLADFTAERLNDPSIPTNNGGDCSVTELMDGSANSRHTYDGITYMPNIDRMFVFGGSPTCMAGGINSDTWTFDFATMTWHSMSPAGTIPRMDYGVMAVYDPNTGKVFLHDRLNLFTYDFATNTFTKIGSDNPIGYLSTAIIDPVRKKFVILGWDESWIYDISAGSSYTPTALSTSGGSAIVSSFAPGLAYDPISGHIAAWNGGNDVYWLNLDTDVWTTETFASGPGSAQAAGTYKRWNYSPALNMFILVNDIDQDAFLFRSSLSGGSTFTTRCASVRVVRCVGFDSDPDFNVGMGGSNGARGDVLGIEPGVGSNYSYVVKDTTQKASGTSSLKFTIPSFAGENSSGSWFANFSDDLMTQYGAGETFYVQWRQRFSSDFLANAYLPGDGWKQSILAPGDTMGMIWDSCEAIHIVTQNVNLLGFPQMYQSCTGSTSHSAYDPFVESFMSTYKLQNGRISPYCLLSQYYTMPSTFFPPDGNCFGYFADEWMTFQIQVSVGLRGSAGVIGASPNDEFVNSHINLWVAREGQPSELVFNWGPYNITAGDAMDDEKYGKLWLLPYHTNKDDSISYPEAYTWYDEVVISTTRIADPLDGGVTLGSSRMKLRH